MSVRARSTALLLACLVSLSARTASSADRASPRVVRIFVAGSAGMLERTRATVRELFARLDLDVVVQEGGGESLLESPPESTFAEAFIDYRPEGAPRIVVVQTKPRRELERRILAEAGSPEMTVEEAAHVVYAVVESSLRAREPRSERQGDSAPGPGGTSPASATGTVTPVEGTTTTATPTPSPKAENRAGGVPAERERHSSASESNAPSVPDVVTDERSRDGKKTAALVADLAVFGSGSLLGAFRPLPGLGVAVDVGAQAGSWRVGGMLLGGSSLSSDVSGKAGDATLRAEFARAFVTAQWQSSRRVAMVSGLGGGVDRIAVDARAAPPRVQSTGTETRIDPSIAGLAGARIGLGGPVSLVAGLFVDLDLTPHRYVVESSGGRAALLELGRVHASALAGLSIALSAAPTTAGTPYAPDAPPGEP